MHLLDLPPMFKIPAHYHARQEEGVDLYSTPWTQPKSTAELPRYKWEKTIRLKQRLTELVVGALALTMGCISLLAWLLM